MRTTFARQTKLSDIVGRSRYIQDNRKQEKVVLYSDENMISDWKEYAKFEKNNRKNKEENNQGREIIIALPNQLENDHEKLKLIINDYAKTTLGNTREYEYAVHWNQQRTNLHAHIIFSERERETENKPKKYKRDMWFDKDTNRMAKANADNAELRYKKGEVMRDKEGNIRYENKLFTIKDTRFTNRSFTEVIKENLNDTLKKYNFESRLFDQSIELPQAKLYKGASKDYLEKATESNQARAEYNKLVVKAVEEKIMPKTIAIIQKENILKKVKKENSKTKSISIKGINYIKESIVNLKNYIDTKLKQVRDFVNRTEAKEVPEPLTNEPTKPPYMIEYEKVQRAYKQEYSIYEESFQKLKENMERMKELRTNIDRLTKEINEVDEIKTTIKFKKNKMKKKSDELSDLNIFQFNRKSNLSKTITQLTKEIKKLDKSFDEKEYQNNRIMKDKFVEVSKKESNEHLILRDKVRDHENKLDKLFSDLKLRLELKENYPDQKEVEFQENKLEQKPSFSIDQIKQRAKEIKRDNQGSDRNRHRERGPSL